MKSAIRQAMNDRRAELNPQPVNEFPLGHGAAGEPQTAPTVALETAVRNPTYNHNCRKGVRIRAELRNVTALCLEMLICEQMPESNDADNRPSNRLPETLRAQYTEEIIEAYISKRFAEVFHVAPGIFWNQLCKAIAAGTAAEDFIAEFVINAQLTAGDRIRAARDGVDLLSRALVPDASLSIALGAHSNAKVVSA